MAIVARRPMTARTVMSSIREKPFSFFFLSIYDTYRFLVGDVSLVQYTMPILNRSVKPKSTAKKTKQQQYIDTIATGCLRAGLSKSVTLPS